ncbi:MAG: hypothetical protein Q9226_002039 [Calogaya cf. arnoldii]
MTRINVDPRWWLLLPLSFIIAGIIFLIKDSWHQRRRYRRPNSALMYLHHELQLLDRHIAAAAEGDDIGEQELQSLDGHMDDATDGDHMGEATAGDPMNGAAQGFRTMSGETRVPAWPLEQGENAEGTQSARGSMDITSTGPITEDIRRKLSAEAKENADIAKKGIIKAADRHRAGFEPQSSEG